MALNEYRPDTEPTFATIPPNGTIDTGSHAEKTRQTMRNIPAEFGVYTNSPPFP